MSRTCFCGEPKEGAGLCPRCRSASVPPDHDGRSGTSDDWLPSLDRETAAAIRRERREERDA